MFSTKLIHSSEVVRSIGGRRETRVGYIFDGQVLLVKPDNLRKQQSFYRERIDLFYAQVQLRNHCKFCLVFLLFVFDVACSRRRSVAIWRERRRVAPNQSFLQKRAGKAKVVPTAGIGVLSTHFVPRQRIADQPPRFWTRAAQISCHGKQKFDEKIAKRGLA